MSPLSKLVARVTPAAPHDHAGPDAWRVRFIYMVHVIGAIVGVVMAGIYALMDMRASAVLTVLLALVLGGRLLLMLRGADATRTTHGSLAYTLLTFAGYIVSERPFDPVMYLWLGLIPYLGTTMLSPRSALRWLLATVAVAFGARLVVAFDLWPPIDVLTTSLGSNFRAISFAFTLFLFVLQFERERQRWLQEVQTASQLKTRFLANMSHEIRTPMNGILGLTEAALLGPVEPGLRETLEVIGRSGRALVTLLNDLLDLSKIEAGKLTLDARTMDLAALIADLRALFRPLVENKRLTFQVNVAPDVPHRVTGDALRLRQVLSNLLGNAVKFTEKGAITLQLARVGPERVRFTVSDTGIGIDRDVVPRLFERFEQGDSSTTRQYGGTGLGLALSSELVTLMGGRLEVDTQLGKGARFWFDLDLPTPEESGGRRTLVVAPTALPAPVQLPVLVVDDNAINCTVASRLLQKLDCRVEVATNGREAVERAALGGLHLILMDCHMPEMDGFEATRRIRALGGPASQVPIVALTASAMPDELSSCLTAGMNDTITKPVTLQALVSALEKLESKAP